MRLLLIIAAAVLIFALIGWISFTTGPDDRSSVNFETGKIRQDTKQAMQSGAELLHKAGDNVEREANRPVEIQATRETATTTTTR